MFFILLHLARGVTFFFPYSPTRGKQAVFPAALRCSFWRLSRSRVSAAVWLRWSRVRAEDECVCECVLRGGGRIHMNERTKFHINQQQITANRRIKALSAFKRWLHALRSLKNGFRLVKAATSTQRQRDCSSGGSEALGFFLSLSRCWCK